MDKTLAQVSTTASPGLDVLVTVVMVPRERFGFTERSLRSIDANTPEGVRILYVDAGSPAYLVPRLKKAFPEGRLSTMPTGRYMSYNEVRNLAAGAVHTKYLVFIDNDVLVRPHWLDHLVDCAEATGADAVNPLCLLSMGGGEIVHFSGGHYEIAEDDAGRHFRAVFDPPVEVPYSDDLRHGLSRAKTGFVEPHCFLVRTDRLPELGMFDEAFKSVHEHHDFSLSVLEHGGEMYVEPASVICYRSDGDWFASDVPFFHLRWCEEWNRKSLDHFYRKRAYVRDDQYALAMEWLWGHMELIGVKRVTRELEEPPQRASPPCAQTNLDLYRQISALGFRDSELKAVWDAYEFAAKAFAGMFRASGRPFLAHLVATASILAAHGAAVPMIVAGLMHDLYKQSALGRTAVSPGPALRDEVRSRFGAEVETVLDRYADLEESRESWAETDPALCELPMAKAIVIRMANDLDDYRAGEFAFSTKRPGPVAEREGDYASAVAGFLGFETLAGALLEASAKEAEAIRPVLKSGRTVSFAVAEHGRANASIERTPSRTAGMRVREAASEVVRIFARNFAAASTRITRSQAWIVPRLIASKLLSDPRWVVVRIRRRLDRVWQRGKAPPHA